ncbi:MAG TPA: crosslink repair DNA glycosylase YcaQ family protein [candidate division Zixibacteria bacterium]|nr:crosslink repair DNA glycosylase YcaQ family protein [candidate division Zixibacteria bacterium]
MHSPRRISPETLRRLAISSQKLVGPRTGSGREAIMEVIRDLGCVQFDPLRAIERTQLLVLRSRLGEFDPGYLDSLLYEERKLFEYWAHAASIVLTEDFPIFWRHMREWAPGDRPWMKRARAWMAENQVLRTHILKEIQSKGPLSAREFQDNSNSKWQSSGWSNGQTVRQMLNYLWEQGEIFISRRNGLTKLWDLRERCLPDWTPREDLAWSEVVYRAAQTSLKALGAGRIRQIERHFTRSNYPDLTDTITKLESEDLIQRIEIEESGAIWPGNWFIHSANLVLLDQIESGDWQPRTNLLSPFDNLICDRDRTEQLFDFFFRIEIYVPKAKRQFGYYVMPILHGDRLIGRIDPKMDRKSKKLVVNNVYAEPTTPINRATGLEVAGAIGDLAAFLGARDVDYSGEVPAGWRKALS